MNPVKYKRLQGKKVLLVDDDMRNTFALSRLLERVGIEAVIAENGQVALTLLESDSEGSFDLVLMDIMMPIMDGYEAMRRIRANKSLANLPIIGLSALAADEIREKCEEAGANDCIGKPVDRDELLAILDQYILKTPEVIA